MSSVERPALVRQTDSSGTARLPDLDEFKRESGASDEHCCTPPIPQGTRPLQLQVAGHVFGVDRGPNKSNLGFLQSEDGTVLKPVIDIKRYREVVFYQAMFSAECSDTALLSLREFVPTYMGMWTTPEHPGQSYIRLDDVTRRFQKPSVMDVKVGSITYDCDADEAKRTRELEKFPILSKIAFQILGFKRYVPETDSYIVRERTFLRRLDEETILTEGLAKFINSGLLADAFLRRLKSIESWFSHQNSYSFIASSLLFVCDSAALHTQLQQSINTESIAANGLSIMKSNGQTSRTDECLLDKLVDVRVIDLAHVFPTDGPDFNYLSGIQSLISYLERLRSKYIDDV